LEFYGQRKFTALAKDWQIFLSIECSTEQMARAIEDHIKKMKSKKYVRDLKQYPEMVLRLLSKYAAA
jgi:putative endonuclease